MQTMAKHFRIKNRKGKKEKIIYLLRGWTTVKIKVRTLSTMARCLYGKITLLLHSIYSTFLFPHKTVASPRREAEILNVLLPSYFTHFYFHSLSDLITFSKTTPILQSAFTSFILVSPS